MDSSKNNTNSENIDFFHSNDFAKIQNGKRFGSISTMTFLQRLEIEKNRQLIYGYQRSKVVNSHRNFRHQVVQSNDKKVKEVASLRQTSTRQTQSRVPIRKYNPYS